MMSASNEPQAFLARVRFGRFMARLGILVGLLAGLVMWLAKGHPEWVEEHYAGRLFPLIRSALVEFSRLLPISLAELGLCVMALGILVLLLRARRAVAAGRRTRLSLLLGAGLGFLGLAGWGYAAFLLCWGLNHARLPYATIAGLEVRSPAEEVQELGDLLEFLVAECNRLRPLIQPEDLELNPGGGRADARLLRGFEICAQRTPELDGPAPVLREPLSSPLLSRLGITGIYSPFTAESHVNGEAPLWSRPFSACHEVAHARGFAREDEANFIAWQVCRAAGDDAFAYSGAYMALSYVSRALKRLDPKRRSRALKSLEPFVLADQKSAQVFWNKKHSVVTEVSHSSNNLYLKAQGQAGGIQSYGRMVGLMLAEWRQVQGQEPSATGVEAGARQK